MEPTTEVRAERMVAGGLALCRDGDGRIVLVDGALPGELVQVEVREHRGTNQGVVTSVIEPAAGRVEAPCRFVALGCGGCDWQHAAPSLQREMRVEIVADALRRLGHLGDPVVRAGPTIEPERTRNSLRLAVDGTRLGLRHQGSHEIVVVDDCLVCVPALAELLAPGVIDPGQATELTIRVASTGERMIVAEPTAIGVAAPEGVAVIGGNELANAKRLWFHTEIAGVRLRVSARSFLQVRTDGAEALVALVRGHIADAPDGPLVDLYGGIGLFAATVGGDRAVVVVESSKAAAADARVNLAGRTARVVDRSVDRWRPSAAAVVVADPARAGLGKVGVTKIRETKAARLVLISCDAASLGRDAGALDRAGYTHVESVVVDMFGHTGHDEDVSRFDRT